MNKVDWYRCALRNLGLASLLRLQLQKKLCSRRRLNKLTSKVLSHPVFARPKSSDFLVFNQIYVEMEYRDLDKIRNPGLILDCGANVGYSSVYFLSKYPKCFVIAVEPDPANYIVLTKNLAPYEGRYKAVQSALWPRAEKLRFVSTSLGSGNEWSRSVRKAAPNDGVYEEIETIDVPKLIASSGYDRVSILKIDIEGAERELFAINTGAWLDKVDHIVIELHGEESSRVFFGAIGSERYNLSTCGELTICLRRDAE